MQRTYGDEVKRLAQTQTPAKDASQVFFRQRQAQRESKQAKMETTPQPAKKFNTNQSSLFQL